MYALWLMPAIKQRIKLAHLIQALSDEHGGPLFDPHITLLADIEGDENRLIDQTRRLASQMTQFSVRVRSLDYLHEYYKSFFIRIEGSDLIDLARSKAQVLFAHKKTSSDFMPHLSLIYGYQMDNIKELIKEMVQSEIETELLVDGCQLMAASGPPENWRTVTSLQFATS